MRPQLVLFVCGGNVTRSPMAAAAFLDALERLNSGKHVVVSSAGLTAEEGAPTNPAALRALEEANLAPLSYAARQLTPEALEAASLVLTMTHWQKHVIAREYPFVRDRLYTLPEYAINSRKDVPDLFDPSQHSYNECLRLLQDLCFVAARRFLKSPLSETFRELLVD